MAEDEVVQLEPLTVDPDVDLSVQKVIIEQELMQWRNTRFAETVRYRTNKRIGDTDRIAGSVKTLTMVESGIVQLESDLATINAEIEKRAADAKAKAEAEKQPAPEPA